MCNSLNTMTFAGNGAELHKLYRKIKKRETTKRKSAIKGQTRYFLKLTWRFECRSNLIKF